MATRAQRRQATQNRLKAMNHPLRSEAFRLIRDKGPVSPSDVARMLSADVRDVSYHVKMLSNYGCVEEAGTRPVRGALEHFYVATEQHMIDTEEWDEFAEQEEVLAEVLVDEFMQTIVDDFTASRRGRILALDSEFHITRTPHTLDPEGVQEALEASAAYRQLMADIAARSATRRLERGTPEVKTSSSIVFFKMPSGD